MVRSAWEKGKGGAASCLPKGKWLSGTWLTKWMGTVMGMPVPVSCLQPADFKWPAGGARAVCDTQALHDSHSELDFVVNNMIFDETELEINLHGYGVGAWSIMASHAQTSF